MNTLIVILPIAFSSLAFGQTCRTDVANIQEIKQDVNTPVPEILKDKTLMVCDKHGENCGKPVPSKDWKMVPRKQQLKVIHTVETVKCEAPSPKMVQCKPPTEDKNTLMLGLRRDSTGYDVSSDNGKSGQLSSRKDAVVDLSYMRHKLVGPLGAGLGIDTNGTPRVFGGWDF